ncbi:MAG: ABC transporter ATP-binding protein [Lachnospiraceae bacterium]|nr:ABC transporter ATP-binding protein [Lachnospiraceae bacterium]
MLRIQNLRKRYGNTEVLKGINFEVQTGEVFGFVGQNGAGKTTTMKIMTGLLAADSGSVEFNGVDLLFNTKYMKKVIGFVPDYFGTYNNLKAIEYMEFFASMYGLHGKEARGRCMRMMDMFMIGDKAETYVDNLSRGMQQKLCMARALLHDPDLLVLDEPTSGMDPQSRLEVKNLLKELGKTGKTIIISSHILPELSEMCDTIGVIEKGEILFQGSMDEIVTAVNVSNPLTLRILDNLDTAVKMLREHPLTKSMAIDGKDIQLSFKGDANAEAELLEQMIANGIKVISFGRKRDNLETVFMRITSKEEGGRKNRV